MNSNIFYNEDKNYTVTDVFFVAIGAFSAESEVKAPLSDLITPLTTFLALNPVGRAGAAAVVRVPNRDTLSRLGTRNLQSKKPEIVPGKVLKAMLLKDVTRVNNIKIERAKRRSGNNSV